MMTHDEIQDLLEGFVDETLDRDTYREVKAHLTGCAECRSILDEVAPVDLSGLMGGSVDERMLRRSVRRAMWRTVIDAALMLLALVLAVWIVGTFVVQPLVVNRGGRAAAAARATYDIAAMFNEGATVTDFTIESTSFRRVFTVDLALPVGSDMVDMGTVATRLGVFGFRGETGGRVWPFVENRDSGGDAREELDRLGSGTVATVAVRFGEPVSIERAQELADSTEHDVRVVWAGFPVDAIEEKSGLPFEPGSVVGYGTCLDPPNVDDDFFAATSASGGGNSGGFSPASIGGALSEVRRALTNLVGHPQLATELPYAGADSLERVQQALTYLSQADPGVVSLVVTGPTPEILGFLDEAASAWTSVLAVDLYNWSIPVCGR
jgi:hypothetical protein